MILYVDIGNSRLKWYVESKGVCVESGGDGLGMLESVVRSIQCALDYCNPEEPAKLERILVSSVASAEVNADFCSFCDAQFSLVPHFVAVEKVYGGVTVAYSDIGTFGVDRWLALLAAHEKVDSSCLVIDAGSAITVDLLGADGVHGGGMIAPGLRTLAASLKQSTKKVEFDPSGLHGGGLSVISGDSAGAGKVSLALGRSTADCVEAGVDSMFCGFISRVVYSLNDRFDSVLIAGGDGVRVMALLENIFSQSCSISGSLPKNLVSSLANCKNEIGPIDGLVHDRYGPKKLSYCPDLVIEGLKRWYLVGLHS